MTERSKIYDFFNGRNSSQTQKDNLKKRSLALRKKEFERLSQVPNPFSDVDWGHPEPEDKNSYEYAKYIANLLLRNGVNMEMSPRDKKKIMEYILSGNKTENVDN